MIEADDVDELCRVAVEQKRRLDLYEDLLREALVWCPRKPTYPPHGKKTQAEGIGWNDLGDRIEAALSENATGS